MKLQLEKFLSLTAMIATAQIGTFACVATDDSSDTDESVEADDDAGADEDEGNDDDDDATDDDATDDDASDDDASDDDDIGDDAGPATEGDDDIASDAGAEGSEVMADAGDETGEVMSDAGAEGGEVMADAGDEGVVWTDAGAEGELPVDGDAGAEGGICLDGSFDAASEAVDCAMFDSCYEDLAYLGTAPDRCWEMASYRRASVYDDFISCYTSAALADPCGEEADATVSACAQDAESMACASVDERCVAIASSCVEVTQQDCELRLAPYDTFYRDAVATCVDGWLAGVGSPDYEGCGLDFDACATAPFGE